MKFKIMAFLVLWMNMALTFAQAQTPQSRIYGRVLDAEGKNIEFATVALLKDLALVKTTFTENDGMFSFDRLGYGKYLIKISVVGSPIYQTDTLVLTATHAVIALPDIKIKAGATNLKEVNISGQKAFVERKIDRTIVNVDALISNAGTTALDVLSKSPGVNVDQNGAISLKGKNGVAIFIDDKPTYLSGADLENYLRSLPSSSLDQIELMTNPPAKYDAAGNGGVINIKTKKTKTAGFNGGINVSLNQGELSRSNNSFNFNYRKDKINVFGNLSYNLNNSFTDLDLNRKYKNADGSTKSYFNQNSYFRRHGNTFNLKTGLDYYASDRTTWGVVLTGMNRISKQVNNNTSNLSNASMQLDSVIRAENIDQIKYQNAGANLNYRHKFKQAGRELTFDADYLLYRNKTDQTYYNFSYLPSGTLKYQDILTGNLPSNIDIYTAKADYSHPLENKWKLDAGVKTAYTKTDNIADYFNTANGKTNADYEKSNHFLYKENINAVYLNMSREGKRFSLQAGLRYENTVSNGHQLGNLIKPDSSFKRTYNSLFPTLYFSYKLDTAGNNQLGLNYGRRIDRPYYQDLNPFFSPLDKFTYYVGNPFLKPSFTQSIELSHIFKNKITTTFSYSWVRDEVNETIEILNGTYYSRPANVGKTRVANVSVNAEIDLTKWAKLNAYMEFGKIVSKTDFYTGFLVTNGSYFRTNPNVQFKISPTWNAEINMSYQSKLSNVQFLLGSVHEFGAAVQKKLSAKSTLKLTANDIFRNRIFNGVINNLAATEASWTNKQDSRNFVLSYSYRFGKAFSSPAKHESSGADAEKSRVKN
ncbi:outer membrane receptor protein involved in Fe transport [Pedobacter sp. AK013]|uniref:outer membrane beta-barrel family protein n=1 Tax=Pedobacter sp. AK013 TaxID=2723071 RepID=UPI001618EEFB|nr:outer membrane beta-barrel family protein [Pedobacter sp. AK013]MBB6235595.1 outer membrane receptor protein involved in Fe transport [Pedobacter sp. AK013]